MQSNWFAGVVKVSSNEVELEWRPEWTCCLHRAEVLPTQFAVRFLPKAATARRPLRGDEKRNAVFQSFR